MILMREAKLLGTNRYAYRNGESARITGVYQVRPHLGADPRMCYQIQYDDGVIDYVPLSEVEDRKYTII
jgi:hypothetical protein